MAKHSIEIAVKTARAQVAAAQRGAARNIPTPGVPEGAAGRRDTRSLAAAIENATRAQKRTQGLMQQQNQLLNSLAKQMSSLKNAIGSGGMGNARATASGLGGLKSSIPVVGLAISAFALLMNKAVAAGRAAMAAIEQQSQTAGIAGFQRAGEGTFGPAEIGRAEYERIIAAGGYGPRGAGSERTAALKYARKTGTDVSEAMRTLGLFQVQGGGFGRSLARMQREGLDVAQFRTVFQELVPALEEAVAGGVSRSGLAADMAKQIATLSRYFPTGTGARAAAATVRNFRSLAEQTARGKWGNLPGTLLMQAAERVAGQEGGLKGIIGTKEQPGMLHGMSPKQIRELMGKDVMLRSGVLQELARDPRTQEEMVRSTVKRFEKSMPGGMPREARDFSMARLIQGTGVLPGQMTLPQIMALIKRSREEPAKLDKIDRALTKTTLAPEPTTAGVIKHGIKQQETLINEAATFIKVVTKLDDASMTLARAGAALEKKSEALGTVATGIAKMADGVPKLIKGMENIGEGLTKLIDELKSFAKDPTGAIKRMILGK